LRGRSFKSPPSLESRTGFLPARHPFSSNLVTSLMLLSPPRTVFYLMSDINFSRPLLPPDRLTLGSFCPGQRHFLFFFSPDPSSISLDDRSWRLLLRSVLHGVASLRSSYNSFSEKRYPLPPRLVALPHRSFAAYGRDSRFFPEESVSPWRPFFMKELCQNNHIHSLVLVFSVSRHSFFLDKLTF